MAEAGAREAFMAPTKRPWAARVVCTYIEIGKNKIGVVLGE